MYAVTAMYLDPRVALQDAEIVIVEAAVLSLEACSPVDDPTIIAGFDDVSWLVIETPNDGVVPAKVADTGMLADWP